MNKATTALITFMASAISIITATCSNIEIALTIALTTLIAICIAHID